MKYLIQQFPITDNQIAQFRRFVKKPRDCVINALELCNIVDATVADIMRVMVGDNGLTEDQICDVFTVLDQNSIWKFQSYTRIETFAEIITNTLQPGYVMFCGYDGHVFIIGKTFANQIVYIDPQIPVICDLSLQECLRYIERKNVYYILQRGVRF